MIQCTNPVNSAHSSYFRLGTEFLRIRQQFEHGEVKLENGRPVVRLIKDDGILNDPVGKLELDDAIVDEKFYRLTEANCRKGLESSLSVLTVQRSYCCIASLEG